MIKVILIEPENEGNIGAICRAMKNFGLKDLILINPKCKLGEEARKRAKHSQDILKNVKIKGKDYLKKIDYLIGTTAKLGTDYNIPRSPINAEQLADKIKGKKSNIAVLFGRESKGLTNKEILECDFIVTIPTHSKYPTLNLSHAATIVFYELFKRFGKEKIGKQIIPINKKEKEQIMKMLNQVLDKMEFATKEKKDTQKTVWKRLIGKSFMTKREAYALMGFLRKIK
jgi:TrmH family RNA methyltransferase